MRRLGLLTAALLLLAGTAVGCSSDDDDKGLGDAPVATNTSSGKKGGDDSPAIVTNMPDSFGNVSTKCVAGRPPWAIIEGTNTDYTGSNFVVVQDPKACGGDWVPGPKSVASTRGKGVEEPDDGS